MTVQELTLKYAAVLAAARKVCDAHYAPEHDQVRRRYRTTQAIKVLRERLNDLDALNQGDAYAAPGIRQGEAS